MKLCRVPDCGRKAHGRGLCATHSYRLKRFGDVLADVPIRGPRRPGSSSGVVCSVPRCGRRVNSGDLCQPHARRLKRYGDVLADLPIGHEKREDFRNRARVLKFFIHRILEIEGEFVRRLEEGGTSAELVVVKDESTKFVVAQAKRSTGGESDRIVMWALSSVASVAAPLTAEQAEQMGHCLLDCARRSRGGAQEAKHRKKRDSSPIST